MKQYKKIEMKIVNTMNLPYENNIYNRAYYNISKVIMRFILLIYFVHAKSILTMLNTNDPVVLSMGLFPMDKVVVDRYNYNIKVLEDKKIDHDKYQVVANLISKGNKYMIKYNDRYFSVTDVFEKNTNRKKHHKLIKTTEDKNKASLFKIHNLSDGIVISWKKNKNDKEDKMTSKKVDKKIRTNTKSFFTNTNSLCITRSHKQLILCKCNINDLIAFEHQKFTVFTMSNISLIKNTNMNLLKMFEDNLNDPMLIKSFAQIRDLEEKYDTSKDKKYYNKCVIA
ncbi:hypothetical protein SLOPH_523, partial [Spraguea lophii 42_110]